MSYDTAAAKRTFEIAKLHADGKIDAAKQAAADRLFAAVLKAATEAGLNVADPFIVLGDARVFLRFKAGQICAGFDGGDAAEPIPGIEWDEFANAYRATDMDRKAAEGVPIHRDVLRVVAEHLVKISKLVP